MPAFVVIGGILTIAVMGYKLYEANKKKGA